MTKQIICFTCDKVFCAESHDWLDPDGKPHQLFPMMCKACRQRSKVLKATEKPRTHIRLPYPDDDDEYET